MSEKQLLSNRYLLVKHIGKGGMANVYIAVDTVLKREVAVKILKGDLSNDELALERFRREANASTRLSHPNIVDIYDVGDDGLNHYIVMEYIKGPTLKQLINKRGPLNYKEALMMMKQLCSAIMEAHRNGIIHRDIKSQNVLIKDDGTVKVVDFGIALANNAMQITSEDSVLGSVHYMAPEIAKGEVANMQSDIYSLGIVFYEMLTGSLPFNGDGAVQVVLNCIKTPMPSVCSYDHNIPQSIENIILKATAKNSLNRYQNVAMMLKDINECLNEKHLGDKKIKFEYSEDISVKKETVNSTKTDKKKKIDFSNYLSVVVLILLAVASIGITVFFLYMSGIIGFGAKEVIVPDIINRRVLEASDILDESGLILDLNSIQREMTKDTEAGLIIRVEPDVGTTVETGSTVKVVVSDGISEVMDDYVGQNIEDVRNILSKYPNLRVVAEAVGDAAEPGTIISQSGIEAMQEFDPAKNNTIYFKYSEYQSYIIPFELIGMNLNDAKYLLDSMNITYVVERTDINSLGLSDEEKAKFESMDVVKVNPETGTSYMQMNDSFVTLYYVE